jgi:hypothetical protein
MSLTFNEFQRELQKRNIDGPNAYMFTLIYERLGECMQQQEEVAKAVLMFADQLQMFVNLRELDVRDVEAIKKKVGMIGRTPGVDVHSVANEPEK